MVAVRLEFAGHFKQMVDDLLRCLGLQTVGARPSRIAAKLEVPWSGQVADVGVVQLHHEGLGEGTAPLERLADFGIRLAGRGADADIPDPHHLQRHLGGLGRLGEDLDAGGVTERRDVLFRWLLSSFSRNPQA